MGCKHNYVFTQGYFYCTKCGRKQYGRTYRKKQGRKIGFAISGIVAVGILGFFFSTGALEINQDNLDKSIQNMPQTIQDAGKTAQNIASESTTIIRDTLNQQLQQVQLEPTDIPVEKISEIPKKIRENNPLNSKPQIQITSLEFQIHQLTNEYRIANGLKTLSWDDSLSSIARKHSHDMASRNYFSHDTLEGKDPSDRARSSGYTCQKVVGNLIYSGIAENIFQNNLYDTVWYAGGIPTSYDWNMQEDIAQTTVDGWMDSSGHRQNILTSTFDREGIGVAISDDDKVYITQNFC